MKEEIEDKKAIEVLKRLLEKGILSEDERAAVLAAIGVLGWTSLAESRFKSLKGRRRK